MPANVKLAVAGSRCTGSPVRRAVGTAASTCVTKRSRSAGDALGGLDPLGFGELERHREADGAGDILGAAAASPLLPAAVQQRLERDAPAHREHARPLRGAELVPGDREGVGAELGGRQREPAGRLHGVEMDGDAALVRDGGDGRDILNRPHLVVRVAERHEHGVVAERGGDGIRIEPAAAVDGHAA